MQRAIARLADLCAGGCARGVFRLRTQPDVIKPQRRDGRREKSEGVGPQSNHRSVQDLQVVEAGLSLHCNSPTCSRAANKAKQCRSADILVRRAMWKELADKNVRAPAVAALPRCGHRVSAVPWHTPRMQRYAGSWQFSVR